MSRTGLLACHRGGAPVARGPFEACPPVVKPDCQGIRRGSAYSRWSWPREGARYGATARRPRTAVVAPGSYLHALAPQRSIACEVDGNRKLERIEDTFMRCDEGQRPATRSPSIASALVQIIVGADHRCR